MIKSNIGKYLKLARLTQRELAERIGTTEVSISRYVNGERIPKATTCIRIAKVLNCKAEDLFCEECSDMAVGMTENNYDKLKDAICELVNLAEDATSREVFEMLDNAGADVIDCLDKLSGYEAIGTIEEFKALKEKNEAKKPIVQMRGVYDDDSGDWLRDEEWNMCPTCKIRNQVYHTWKWCHYCGQKLDWSE